MKLKIVLISFLFLILLQGCLHTNSQTRLYPNKYPELSCKHVVIDKDSIFTLYYDRTVWTEINIRFIKDKT